MKVYHTSNIKIYNPDTVHSRNALDFGKGFYVTKLKEQAEKYAKRFTALGEDAFMHTYEFIPQDGLRMQVFDSYNEDWLKFICSCRNGGTEYENFDIIEGGIANDKVFRTIDLYMSGIYNTEQALQQLIYEKPNHQICFITQKAIDCCLQFIECVQINAKAR